MILDERNEFCDATALNTGGADTYLLGDQIDLGLQGGGVGNNVIAGGEDMFLVLTVDTTATSGGSATGQFHLASDSTASIATNGSATYHWSSPAIPVATLVAGYVIGIVRLPLAPDYEQFLGILQTTGTAAFTAGKINAFLTNDPAKWVATRDAAN